MIFKQIPITPGYVDLEVSQDSSGRRYVTPEGNRYPSVTTVLGVLPNEGLAKWKARLGEEEAARQGAFAANRGTAVHEICERYLQNDPDFNKGVMPHIQNTFNQIKNILDTRIKKVYAQEIALYSDHLRMAGRVDLVAQFDNSVAIVDFKTSKKPKPKKWIENYFVQETAYSIMWEERTGIPIRKLVTIIAVDDGEPQVFIEDRNNWIDRLIEIRDLYEKENS